MPSHPSESAVEKRAAELHARAVVIDCHCDLLMPIADGVTRLAADLPVTDAGPGCAGQYSLPKFERGGLTTQVCAIFVEDERLDHAMKRALDMTWWFHREMADNADRIEMVTHAADIRRLKAQGTCGAVLALEGFEPLSLDLKMLDIFYKLGVRMGGMAHNRRNAWCDGTLYNTSDAGLTPLGKQAVQRMNELGIVVDIGHLTAKGIWETLEITKAPVVLSHRSPKKFFPLRPEDSPFHPVYDLSQGRERMEALAKNGGVFGVFFLNTTSVGDVVDDIEYVFDLVGPDHVGLGSDLYGKKSTPYELADMAGLPLITRELVRRGHSDEVILKVLGGNFMRVFEEVWKG
jgi:membrane dipeptidase